MLFFSVILWLGNVWTISMTTASLKEKPVSLCGRCRITWLTIPYDDFNNISISEHTVAYSSECSVWNISSRSLYVRRMFRFRSHLWSTMALKRGLPVIFIIMLQIVLLINQCSNQQKKSSRICQEFTKAAAKNLLSQHFPPPIFLPQSHNSQRLVPSAVCWLLKCHTAMKTPGRVSAM